MDVNVYQAGKKRAVAEVYDFSSLRPFDAWTNFDDAFVLDKNLAGSNDFPRPDLKQARGVEDDCLLRNGRRRLGKHRIYEKASHKKDG